MTFLNFKFKFSDLKPKTTYEWFKFILDLIVLLVFLYMIYINTMSYTQGFNDCLKNCWCLKQLENLSKK
jgi:hypothetical protein